MLSMANEQRQEKRFLIDDPEIRKLTGIDGPIDVNNFLEQAHTADLEDSLYKFVEEGWRHIDPAPFVPGWHLEAIAEHLEAVCDGSIKRLIINQPPRTSKSSMIVGFDPWCWAQTAVSDTSGPGVQFLHTSYAQTLSIRDSVKTRRLIDSEWYQKKWGKRYSITSDQNTKVRFDLNTGGYRLATSVGGALTGEGSNIIFVDDPHNAVEMESEIERQNVIDWFDNSLSTRLNNPRTGAIVLVMQRLHEGDLTGHILASEDPRWVHLMLPMKYEAERARIIYPNRIGWSDPRTEENELLTPERYDAETVKNLERQLGIYQSAGQLQQRPSPKGGGIIKRDYWQPWEQKKYPECSFVIGYLDTAYTEDEENDPSGMTVFGVFEDAYGNARAMLLYAWDERLEFDALIKRVGKTAKDFQLDRLLIENKAAGLSIAQELRRVYKFEDFGILMDDPKGKDKIARAYSIQHIFEDGMIHAPDQMAWAEKVIMQCEQFPKGTHDEYVDCVSATIRHLRRIGVLERGSERTAATAEESMHQGNAGRIPLYPV